nr:WPP domain-interacting tail-anchored protein 1 [Tanacetum cinerariifolium]
MVTTASYDASSRTSSFHSSGTSSISIKTPRDSESTGEIIARFELDIAFICERLTNLNLLSMHVETRESNFEPFVSDDIDPDLVVKVLEYDLLARVFGSEVRLLETHIAKTTLENFYEACHSSELLMESSNEVLSRIKMLHFNLKGSVHREAEFKNLKSKVTRAKGQTDSVEDKCIILSEANDDLKKELSFVKGWVRCLETSLHQIEEAKKAYAKDISIRSKFITDLVMQMAHQRERLQKQIASLKHENKILVKSLRKRDEGHAEILIHGDKASSDFTTYNKEALSSNSEMASNETVMDSTEAVRNISAR